MRSAKPIDTRTALQIYFNYPNEIGNAELREDVYKRQALESALEERFYAEGIKYFEEALQWDGEDMALWEAACSCFVHVPEERENAGDYFMLTCIIVENSDDEKIVEELMERMDFEPVRRTMACSRFLICLLYTSRCV